MLTLYNESGAPIEALYNGRSYTIPVGKSQWSVDLAKHFQRKFYARGVSVQRDLSLPKPAPVVEAPPAEPVAPVEPLASADEIEQDAIDEAPVVEEAPAIEEPAPEKPKARGRKKSKP